MNKSIFVIKIIVVGYAVIVAMFFILQNKLIFYAQPLSPTSKSMFSSYAISFEGTEGHTLRGWYRERGPRHPVLMYFGGNAEEVSGQLATVDQYERGSMLLVNYRGYGESEGAPSTHGLKADSLAIFDQFLEKTGVLPSQVILIGRSLGSGMPHTWLHIEQLVESFLLPLILRGSSVNHIWRGVTHGWIDAELLWR